MNVGLEREVTREKHCWELPDLLKPLLACQMNQTTEYWISKIYEWEFEEVYLWYKTRCVNEISSVLSTEANNELGAGSPLHCLSGDALFDWQLSWSQAATGKTRAAHSQELHSSLVCETFWNVGSWKGRRRWRSKTSVNFPSALPSLNWDIRTHVQRSLRVIQAPGRAGAKVTESTFFYSASAATKSSTGIWQHEGLSGYCFHRGFHNTGVPHTAPFSLCRPGWLVALKT